MTSNSHRSYFYAFDMELYMPSYKQLCVQLCTTIYNIYGVPQTTYYIQCVMYSVRDIMYTISYALYATYYTLLPVYHNIKYQPSYKLYIIYYNQLDEQQSIPPSLRTAEVNMTANIIVINNILLVLLHATSRRVGH